MSKIQKRVDFVLSTGRTGTTYLCRALNASGKDIVAVQEPLPSRYLYLSANATNRMFDDASLMLHWYAAGLRKRVGKAGEAKYIEFNPYLCPFAEKLCSIADNIHVLHIVRDPRTWVPSQLNFGAYGVNRHFIDWVPFNMPGSLKKYRVYSSGDISKIQKVIWRWSDFNRRIESLEGRVTGYRRIRFEDIFSSDGNNARSSNGTFLQALDLEKEISVEKIMHRPAENRSQPNTKNAYSRWSDRERRYLDDAASAMMKRYGYGDMVRDEDAALR